MSVAANRRTGLALAAFAAGMVGLAYAAVPLYEMFCRVTGFAGTPLRSASAPGAAGERTIVVRFNADLAGSDLPWSFAPVERQIEARLGEERTVSYRAVNRGDAPVVGTATFNVTPHKAGPYFHKISCFCFTEQLLAPGQSADMPVSFFVDPDIAKDPNLRDVQAITLSYTFFRARSRATADPAVAAAASR